MRFRGANDFGDLFSLKLGPVIADRDEKRHGMENGMGSQYQLGGLNDSQVVTGLSDLVRRSNELTAEMLAHLAELEVRMIHLELGYASAFAYCVQALGLSEAAAGRRLTGARVCRKFPEAYALVAEGALHLSALCELAPHLTLTNASELFAACRRKSRRQIEALLAARFPKPDVREQIRRIPVRAESPAQTDPLLDQICRRGLRCRRPLVRLNSNPQKLSPMKRVRSERFRANVTGRSMQNRPRILWFRSSREPPRRVRHPAPMEALAHHQAAARLGGDVKSRRSRAIALAFTSPPTRSCAS